MWGKLGVWGEGWESKIKWKWPQFSTCFGLKLPPTLWWGLAQNSKLAIMCGVDSLFISFLSVSDPLIPKRWCFKNIMWKEERKWLPQPGFLLLSSLWLWQQDKTCYEVAPDVLNHRYREKGHCTNYFFPLYQEWICLSKVPSNYTDRDYVMWWGGAGVGTTAPVRISSIST